MRRYRWTMRSALWFVFLVALGLKVATGTWHNLKRRSVEYHRELAERCESMSTREQRFAAQLEDEAISKSGSDPELAAELRKEAVADAGTARSYSLLAASLSEKAVMCENSRLEWISWHYETSQNPPRVYARHVSNRRPGPWWGHATLNALFEHPVMSTLSRVDFFWLACLVLAIVGRKRLARVRGVGGPPTRPDLAPN